MPATKLNLVLFSVALSYNSTIVRMCYLYLISISPATSHMHYTFTIIYLLWNLHEHVSKSPSKNAWLWYSNLLAFEYEPKASIF